MNQNFVNPSCAMSSQKELPKQDFFQLLEQARLQLNQLQKSKSPKATELISTIQQMIAMGEIRGLL
jgi:flagellar hook-basal body complex protein FliE